MIRDIVLIIAVVLTPFCVIVIAVSYAYGGSFLPVPATNATEAETISLYVEWGSVFVCPLLAASLGFWRLRKALKRT
jgi:hypothetical protein